MLFLVLILTMCSQNKNTDIPFWVNLCPDMTWLDALKSSPLKVEIYVNVYKGERVFEVNPCAIGCADVMVSVYNCERKKICDFGGIAGVNTCPDYEQHSAGRVLYWKN